MSAVYCIVNIPKLNSQAFEKKHSFGNKISPKDAWTNQCMMIMMTTATVITVTSTITASSMIMMSEASARRQVLGQSNKN